MAITAQRSAVVKFLFIFLPPKKPGAFSVFSTIHDAKNSCIFSKRT